jgi:D-inositol-3-phosphate glycosyltransferase
MKLLPKVLHLVDDDTAGGVMRVLDFLSSDNNLAQTALHEVKFAKRGKIIRNVKHADVIISHLAVSWRSMPILIALRAACTRKALVHVEHNYTKQFMAHNVPNHNRFKILLKMSYSCFDRVISVSSGQKNWMLENHLISVKKIALIQSCVDLTAFRALPAPSGPSRVFGAIGRLDKQKGFDILIKAFLQCNDPNIKLHVIGEGPQRKRLKSLAKTDERIVFKGFQSNPVMAFSDIDVVMMPSRWEAYGLVAIEALAAGRRLLCHNIDGLTDHEQHGGIMFNTTGIEELSSLIKLEANSVSKQKLISTVRTTQQLEDQFRACWWSILRELDK